MRNKDYLQIVIGVFLLCLGLMMFAILRQLR